MEETAPEALVVAIRDCAASLRHAPAGVLAIVVGYAEACGPGLVVCGHGGWWRLRVRAADDAAWLAIPVPLNFSRAMAEGRATGGFAACIVSHLTTGHAIDALVIGLARFDLARHCWQALTPSSVGDCIPLVHVSAVAVNDAFVYVAGRQSLSIYRCVGHAYDRERNEWRRLPEMRESSRILYSMTATATQLFVIGGMRTRSCEVLDIGRRLDAETPADAPADAPADTPAWRDAPQLPAERHDHASILIGPFIYVMGGLDGVGARTVDIHALDAMGISRGEVWQLSPWRLPRPIRAVALHATADGDVIVADTTDRSWRSVRPADETHASYIGRPGAPWTELPRVPFLSSLC